VLQRLQEFSQLHPLGEKEKTRNPLRRKEFSTFFSTLVVYAKVVTMSRQREKINRKPGISRLLSSMGTPGEICYKILDFFALSSNTAALVTNSFFQFWAMFG